MSQGPDNFKTATFVQLRGPAARDTRFLCGSGEMLRKLLEWKGVHLAMVAPVWLDGAAE
jgi:hypothetical protein